ncbi:MAG TPA: ABC transporter permease, partial [Thermoanaerobaculia bacterium]
MGWSKFFRRRRWDEERSRELAAHIDIETDENVANGMPPEEARAAAQRRLGNSTRVREEIYWMNSIRPLETLSQDLRHGIRVLRSNPGFTTVAILSLALGVGANTAIFQLLDAVRIRALPVESPGELVEVRLPSRSKATGSFNGRRPELTNPLWESVRDQQRVFSGMVAWGAVGFNVAQGGEARYVEGLLVNGAFFQTLGVRAAAGRLFVPADDVRGCDAPGTVISDAFARREFGGAASAVGKTLHLDGIPFEVIGVTEPRFFGMDVGRRFDVALPICTRPLFGPRADPDRRDSWFLA